MKKHPAWQFGPLTSVKSCPVRESVYVIRAGVAPPTCSSDHCELYIEVKDREERPWYE